MVSRVLAAILFGCLLFAQSQPSATILLDAKDPAGAAVPAYGRIENLTTGQDRRFQLDAAGKHTLDNVPFGRYKLELTHPGLAPRSLTFEVRSTAPVVQSITLSLAPTPYQLTVVGAAPLLGVDRAANEIPANVQSGNQRDIEASGAIDLSAFLNRRLGSVYVNEIQGNPYQPDVNYRGYTASPLLGTPQGLSIYMDGVRLNQPFGDVVSWDLIPRIAIAETTLMPGSNPLFGLNTLGGALSLQTKDGRRPVTALEIGGGSFGRKTAEFEHGGANRKGLDWYLAGSFFFEDGWRESSPSNVRQFFGKLGWQRNKTVLSMSLAYVNNSLAGNGLQELRFLDRNYSGIYTKPDITNHRAPFLNLSLRQVLSSSLTFSGNAYYRYIRTSTLNGDMNEDSLDQAIYQPSAADIRALTAAGFTGFPTSGATAANTPFPSWRCIAQSLQRDEPAEKCNGLLNRGYSKQHNYGTSGQLSWFTSSGPNRNQFTAGAGYDRSSVAYQQSSQLGYLNPDRSVTGVNSFGDGVTGGEVDEEPYDTRVDLDGVLHTSSVYATDMLSIGSAWNLTFSGRYNRSVIDNTDRIRPLGAGSLSGLHTFNRFNPAAGITFQPIQSLNAYFGYSEGNRAPTSIELGCADPGQPCKLPNAMAGDPPLKQVVTGTFEAGLRGEWENNTRWNIGFFHADNRNDILFVASEQTGFGYFKNFGKTRRQGLEAGFHSRIRRIGFGANYTLLQATFQSEETVNGTGNSTNEAALRGGKGLEGVIETEPGDHIPLVPTHLFKTFAAVQATSKLSIDLNLLAASGAYARGNENNRHQPDNRFYLGSGSSPGYAVVHLGARYQVHRHVQLNVQINNLLNRRYYTAAQLGATGLTADGAFIARPFPAINGQFPVQQSTFYAPGAPRGAWAGLRFTF